ncbi:hypothetical protein [Nocardia lijiangensis]|uniref:hypothetical protein n=1 Tax=Nocardia lijiangensis TaxID=299618 RepID=UPI0008324798|nr:hypothetical protein [Nocardia lijiangensis]
MTILRSAFVAAITAATVTAGMTTSAADPARPAEPVTYHIDVVDRSVVTTLDRGIFALAADAATVAVRDAAGELVDTLPLSAILDGQQLPLTQQVSADGRTLTLTPDLSGLDRSTLTPIASPLENQLAMNDLINAVSLSTSLGSLVGTAIGAIAGIGIGFVLAGASCVALSLGCVVAVLPIMALTAGVGGITGLILAGGPVAIGAAFEYLTTLSAPDGASKYGEQTRGKPGGAPAPIPQ